MIFGKPKDPDWVERFAWFPIRLTDGRWAWLEKLDYSKGQKSYFARLP
jgi:hypothetical protein